MIVRRFERGDADALADLFHASVHALGIRDYSPDQVAAWSPARPDPDAYVQRAASRTFLVAVDDSGAIAGYGDLESDGHIDHLYCRPDLAGTGVGSAIYAAIESIARTSGTTVLFVEASEGARRLLERRGFAINARNDFTHNGVAIYNYLMSKRIA